MKYEPVIGLEIHIQAKTKTKMFSAVSADYFGKKPNTNVDPVSLGLPGALPVPNKKAIELCIKLGMGLNCEISKFTKFDRKNYFYQDLPKGYQISQYDKPIGLGGYVDLPGLSKRINITRIHMEEDTGKSIHEGNTTYLDFNKAGVPLIEVVTEPEFKSGDEIDYFAKRMRQMVRYLGVSDGDMEKGQIRYELNISLRKPGETALPEYKVEVKNIGSISLLQKVLDYEVERQTEILNSGKTPVQETRGAKAGTGETVSQRVKEEADDYRYFPEPDIPPLNFSDDYLESIRESMPKLPQEFLAEYQEAGLEVDVAETIVADETRNDLFRAFFEEFQNDTELIQEAAKYVLGELAAEEELEPLSAKAFAHLYQLKKSGEINSSAMKDTLMSGGFQTPSEVGEFIEAKGYQIDQSLDVKAIAEKVITAEADAKERYAKNPKLAMYFVGQIMKETKGAVNPEEARKIVVELLES